MYAAGIDIGTTTISMIVLDTETGMVAERKTIENNSFYPEGPDGSRLQNAEQIWLLTERALSELLDRYGEFCGIGMTGQMHGMLYVDREGRAVSPFYTWQDKSGDRLLPSGVSSVEYLKLHVGASAAGYGIATHYYLQQMDKIPANAARMTTISDYVAMRFCKNTVPVIAPDMAASWGCYDLGKGGFLIEALERAGVDTSYLPRISRLHGMIGRTKKGIPVFCSLGDNQASVIGSVRSLDNTLLINVGTGSQVSMGTSRYIPCSGSVELRPCPPDNYLMVGSSLCGGRAYAMLEQFYRAASGTGAGSLYTSMLTQAEQFLREFGKEAAWKVTPTFAGTRDDPQECGRIENISAVNFHPGAMTAGMILGILEELYGYYETMCRLTGRRAQEMVGSGNGLRKNPLMKRLAEERFGMPMKIPQYPEEAAYGAALCAMTGSGAAVSLEDAQQRIRYINE